jgi:hypothetical protein
MTAHRRLLVRLCISSAPVDPEESIEEWYFELKALVQHEGVTVH